jgi:rSAM/selenodomain-associated transferase 1
MTLDYFGIFAKYWQPGKVKTRLAAAIGNEAASDVYCAILNHLITSLNSAGDRRVIAYTPVDKAKEFSIFPHWHQTPQSDGTLGIRMANYFTETFAADADRVVLIGSDCPDITPDIINEAFESLTHADVVLGPTFDGGYYLVGMAGKFHDIFSDITYSTESVLDETLALAKRNNVNCHCLDRLNDIDEIDDLNQYIQQLKGRQTSSDASTMEAVLLEELTSFVGRDAGAAADSQPPERKPS